MAARRAEAVPGSGRHRQLAKSASNTSNVYLVPAFTGLGAPYWDPEARGAIARPHPRHRHRREWCAPALEAVCYQTQDLMAAMSADGGTRPTALAGRWRHGAQRLGAAIPGRHSPASSRTAACHRNHCASGAAFCAGLGTGMIADVAAIEKTWRSDRRFEPKMTAAERDRATRDGRMLSAASGTARPGNRNDRARQHHLERPVGRRVRRTQGAMTGSSPGIGAAAALAFRDPRRQGRPARHQGFRHPEGNRGRRRRRPAARSRWSPIADYQERREVERSVEEAAKGLERRRCSSSTIPAPCSATIATSMRLTAAPGRRGARRQSSRSVVRSASNHRPV